MGARMTKMLLRYVHEFRDRHGRTRRMSAAAASSRCRCPVPGSEEFMEAYRRAVDEDGAANRDWRLPVIAGTIADLVVRYYRSPEFAGAKGQHAATYRSIIEPFREAHGEKRVAMLKREHVKDMLARKAATPTAGNNWLKRMRQLTVFAIDIGMRTDDPTIGVKPLRITSAWSSDMVGRRHRRLPRRHPSGTRARLAMEMALCTMQRRSDLVRMGRQHLQSRAAGSGKRRPGPLSRSQYCPSCRPNSTSCRPAR